MAWTLSRRGSLAGAASVILAATVSPIGMPLAIAATLEQVARFTPGAKMTIAHEPWSKMLAAYVAPDQTGLNRVDYKRWKAEAQAPLKAYVAMLEATDPTKLDRAEAMAFWINLYNAKTIEVVLDRYPVKSIKDISLGGGLKALVGGGPWQANITKINGLAMSLDDIEHKVLRPVFKDPRVHYAVNCASYGCPNLQPAAFTGATLEALLETGAKAFINHPRGIAVQGGKVTASSIFTWFESDFGGSATKVLDHVRNYAEPALAKQLEGVNTIASYDYNWSLNDVAR